MKQVIRYKCDFCQKLAAHPKTIERHEKVCLKNPDGKNCYMCEMAYLDDFEIYHDYNGTYSTVKDQCMCAYTDDVVSSTIGSADGYWYRNREQAEKNLEKYWG